MDNITNLGILLPRFFMEMLAAFFCGALFGIERGAAKRGVGLRETILICIGTTILMMVGELVDISTGEGGIVNDPGRLAGFIIVAIGLLSAGPGFSRSGNENVLGSSATVWVTASIGLLIGIGYPLLGILATVAILLSLMVVRGLETHLVHKPRPLLLRVMVREDSPELRRQLQAALERNGVHPDNFRADPIPNGVKITVAAAAEPEDIRPLLSALWTVSGVSEVEH